MIQGNNGWIEFLLDEYFRTPESSGPLDIQSPPSRNFEDNRDGDHARDYNNWTQMRFKDALTNPHTRWSQTGHIDAEPPPGLGPLPLAEQQEVLNRTRENDMTSPFTGRKLGARASAGAFPKRSAIKKPPGFFLGGLFSGTPASSTSTSKSSTDFSVTDPNYNALKDYTLKQGLALAKKPYEAYGGQGVVGLSGDQTQAFADVRGNQGNYQPFYNTAAGAVNRVAGMDPTAAGMPHVDQASGMTTGSQAASPFVGQASKTFPGQVDQYMSPYTEKVVDRIADLGNRNLTENILPGVNDTFTGGDAAQFGRERHADITGRAIRDTQESIMGQQSEALERGYAQAGNLFNADQNRAAGLAGTTGQLAQGDIAQRVGMGQTAAGITAQGVQSGVQAGQAATGLGQATQASGLTDANALAASGAQQQTQAQNEETWKYNQFKEKQNDPYAKAMFGQGISQGWTLPTNTSTQGSSTTTQQAAQGSPFGQIMGAGIGMLGAAGGIPGLGALFGGASAPGSGWIAATGGQVPNYAQGGMIPSITAMRRASKGTMPTGMPGMPPMPSLAPQLPKGQPNGQMASPFARGGYTGREGC